MPTLQYTQAFAQCHDSAPSTLLDARKAEHLGQPNQAQDLRALEVVVGLRGGGQRFVAARGRGYVAQVLHGQARDEVHEEPVAVPRGLPQLEGP